MPSRNIIEILIKAITGDAKKELKSFSKETQQELGALEKVAAVAVGAMSALLAQRVGSMVVDMARMAAMNMEVADSFEALASRYDLDSDRILAALKRASKGTVSDADLMVQANKALRLGVATTVQEFEQLMKIAMIRAREFGLTVAEAWEYIVVGIGRASPMILDNIGILMDAEKTYKDYAEAIGKSADQLTVFEKKEAIRSRILREGADDLERWGDVADTAATKLERFDASIDNLQQSIGEMAAGPVADLADKLATLPTIFDQLGYVAGVNIAGIKASWAELLRLIETGDWAAILEGQTNRVGEAAMIMYARQDAAAKGVISSFNDLDMKLRDVASASAGAASAQDELGEATDEAANAAKRAEDIWHSYLTDVAEENWRFARAVEDANFKAAQSAEDAAFRRFEIEQSAANQRADLWDRYWLDERFETLKRNDQLKWMQQDLLDSLRDMEWNYLQEKRDMLDQAPWWVRQALQQEFAQRDRIVASGDKEALREFDRTLKERIKQIDPVYAEMLERLEERYEHEEEIEKREATQSRERRRSEWSIQDREQRAQIDLQLRQLDRGLRQQLDAWAFHDRQRRENERWAMDRLISEHGHDLNRMYDDTQWRLSRLPDLYRHYGYENWLKYVQGWKAGQADVPMVIPTPATGGGGAGPKRHQWGAWNVPRNELAYLHRGEMVVPAPVAERWRGGEGGIIINIENLSIGAGVGMASGRQLGRTIGYELGAMILQQRR